MKHCERKALEIIKRQSAEITNLTYILQGVMLSVDKWLEGDELKQDEVNRAITMREKTLQIVEAKQAEIAELRSELVITKNNFDNVKEKYDEAVRTCQRNKEMLIEAYKKLKAI